MDDESRFGTVEVVAVAAMWLAFAVGVGWVFLWWRGLIA